MIIAIEPSKESERFGTARDDSDLHLGMIGMR